MQELPFSAKPSPLLHSPVPPRLGGGRERRGERRGEEEKSTKASGHRQGTKRSWSLSPNPLLAGKHSGLLHKVDRRKQDPLG